MEQNKFYLNHPIEGIIEIFDLNIVDRLEGWIEYKQIVDGEMWDIRGTIPSGDIRQYISKTKRFKPIIVQSSNQMVFDESVKTIYWDDKREVKYLVNDITGNYKSSISKIKYFKIIFDSTRIKIDYHYQAWSNKSKKLEYYIGYETFDKNLYSSLLDFKSKHIFEMYKDAKSSVDYFWKIGFGQRERKACETKLELHAQKKTRLYSSQEEPRLWQQVGYDMR